MKSYSLWLVDLDGTMYRGTEKIEEAPLFIEHLYKERQSVMFVTNNSSKTPLDVVRHLASVGIEAKEEQVYTSSMATAHYVTSHKERPSVYMVGEHGLKTALQEAGCRLVENPEDLKQCDYVVMGIDQQVNYEKLARASLAVRKGAEFISTNADKALPTERGLIPGNGAISMVVKQATGTQPRWIGKPEPLMIDFLLQQKACPREEAIMIGDNYDTDILAGVNAHVDTALVLSGLTTRDDLRKVDRQPTYVWNTLLDAFQSPYSNR